MEDNILKLPKSLTKDENITLFKKMLNSSKEEAEEIRKNIITGNLRLVVETIKKYRKFCEVCTKYIFCREMVDNNCAICYD